MAESSEAEGRSRARGIHRPDSALLGGCLTGLAISWNLTNTGAIAGVLAGHYGTGLVVVGLLTSIAFGAEFVVMIPGGRAIDRFGARRVALMAVAVCVVGNALLLVVPGVVGALLLRFVIGFGVGAGFVAGSVWIASDARGRTALGQGLYGGISLTGAGLATGIVPLLEGPLGWRSSYWTGLGLSAVALVIAAGCHGERGHSGRHKPMPLRVLLGSQLTARLGVLHSASFALSVVVGNWIVTLLTRHLDMSYAGAGVVGALTLILGVVGRPLGGWAGRHSAGHTYALLAGSLAAGAAATVVFAFSGSLALDVVAACVLGLASGLPFGVVVTAATTAFPQAPGEAIGAFNLYAVTSIIVATPLVGFTFSLRGGGRVGFVAVAVLAAVGVAAVPRDVFSSAAAVATPSGQ